MGQKTITSAHDIALISCELLKHPKILEYTGIWMDSIRDGKFSLANTNKMLKSYPGLTGLKTGYISEAGFCISASAERDGLSLVAVVMAAPTKETRMADASALLNYGFANFTVYTPPDGLLQPVPVQLGDADFVQPEMQADQSFVVEKEKAAQLETHLDIPDVLQAPIAAGQQIGELTVSSGGETLLSIPVTAAEDVGAMTVPGLLLEFLGKLAGGAA